MVIMCDVKDCDKEGKCKVEEYGFWLRDVDLCRGHNRDLKKKLERMRFRHGAERDEMIGEVLKG